MRYDDDDHGHDDYDALMVAEDGDYDDDGGRRC